MLCGYDPLGEKLILSLQKNTFSQIGSYPPIPPGPPLFSWPSRLRLSGWSGFGLSIVTSHCVTEMRGLAAQGCQMQNFCWAVGLSMAALDILGIGAEFRVTRISMLCGYNPARVEIVFSQAQIELFLAFFKGNHHFWSKLL